MPDGHHMRIAENDSKIMSFMGDIEHAEVMLKQDGGSKSMKNQGNLVYNPEVVGIDYVQSTGQ